MTPAERNIALYPWFKFFQNLPFWQAIWFLYFQAELSAADAILLYAVYDISTTVLEVPSGYLSDRLGRRFTLLASAFIGLLACVLFVMGGNFWVFALGQAALGAHIAFASGTDTSFLYESLAEEGRAGDVEAEELRAWRFNFAALAISAVTGGAMALLDIRLPFVVTALAYLALVAITLRLTEPTHAKPLAAALAGRKEVLRAALVKPELVWLFGISVLMYGFSHLPFIFGQPFILEALKGVGFNSEAPLVSGAVTSAMMLLSIATSWIAPGLRRRIGLRGILFLAFGIQIALVAGLALTGSALAIGLLLFRMVPDSFSRPFIIARIQPELSDEVRATYLSLKSLVGRVLFAVSLYLASVTASEVGEMPYSDIQTILAAYAFVGVACLIGLFLYGRRLSI